MERSGKRRWGVFRNRYCPQAGSRLHHLVEMGLVNIEERQSHYLSNFTAVGRTSRLQSTIEKIQAGIEDEEDDVELTLDDLEKGWDGGVRPFKKSTLDKARERVARKSLDETFQIDPDIEKVQLEDLKVHPIKVEDEFDEKGNLWFDDIFGSASFPLQVNPPVEPTVKTEPVAVNLNCSVVLEDIFAKLKPVVQNSKTKDIPVTPEPVVPRRQMEALHQDNCRLTLVKRAKHQTRFWPKSKPFNKLVNRIAPDEGREEIKFGGTSRKPVKRAYPLYQSFYSSIASSQTNQLTFIKPKLS